MRSAMRPASISASRSTPVAIAHLLAQQDQFFGRYIARRPRLAGKRTSAKSADGRIEPAYALPHALKGIGDAEAAGVVQM